MLPLAQIGPDWLITWLTPLWIIGAGALLGLLLLLVAWVITAVVSRRAGAEVPVMISEGPLLPITVVIGIFGALIGGLVLRFLLALTGFAAGFVGAVLGAMLLIWLWRTYWPKR